MKINFSLPKKIPDKKTFMKKVLNAIFPELDKKGGEVKPGDYKAACRRAVKELGMADKYTTSGSYTEFFNISAAGEDFYGILIELNDFDIRLFNHGNFEEDGGGFEKRMVDYNNSIFNLMNSSAKTLNSIIDGKTQKMYRKFETASFFSWLLLKRKECRETAPKLLGYCLKAQSSSYTPCFLSSLPSGTFRINTCF